MYNIAPLLHKISKLMENRLGLRIAVIQTATRSYVQKDIFIHILFFVSVLWHHLDKIKDYTERISAFEFSSPSSYCALAKGKLLVLKQKNHVLNLIFVGFNKATKCKTWQRVIYRQNSKLRLGFDRSSLKKIITLYTKIKQRRTY